MNLHAVKSRNFSISTEESPRNPSSLARYQYAILHAYVRQVSRRHGGWWYPIATLTLTDRANLAPVRVSPLQGAFHVSSLVKSSTGSYSFF